MELTQHQITLLNQIDETTLRTLLKNKRTERQQPETIPPLPPYTPNNTHNDQLNFEYGLELAFRPTTNPHTITPQTLTTLLHTSAKPIKDQQNQPHWQRDKSTLQTMFKNAIPNITTHINAKPGTTHITLNHNEIEFPSPIMTKLSQIEWYYKLIKNLANHINAQTHTKTKNSGGGHIHVTPKNTTFTHTQTHTILTALANNPWLTWIFNDPDDTTTAQSIIKDITQATWHAAACHNLQNWHKHLEYDNTTIRKNNGGNKTTIEFRLFAAPHNWTEQKHHIQFLDKWLTHLLKHPKKQTNKPPQLKYQTITDLQKITLNHTLTQFNKLLTKLKLPHQNYTTFTNRNLKTRYKNNWTRN